MEADREERTVALENTGEAACNLVSSTESEKADVMDAAMADASDNTSTIVLAVQVTTMPEAADASRRPSLAVNEFSFTSAALMPVTSAMPFTKAACASESKASNGMSREVEPEIEIRT